MTDRKFTPPTEFPAEYVTSDGRKAVLLGIMPDPYFPLIGYVADSDGQCSPDSWDETGSFGDYNEHINDLHDIPKEEV